MTTGDIGSVIDTLVHDPIRGTENNIAKVNDTIALIFYWDADSNHKLATVQVDPTGQITDTVIDTLVFNGAWAGFLWLIERATGLFVMTFRGALGGAGPYVYAASVTVDGAGDLPASITDTVLLHDFHGIYTCCFYYHDDIVVAVYQKEPTGGWISTFTCNALGILSSSYTDRWEFETGISNYPRTCKVSYTHVAVVWQHADLSGRLATIPISTFGTITKSFTDTLTFEATNSTDSRIIHMQGDIYAIVYTGPNGHGFLATVDIDSSGNIGAAVLDTYEFETTDCNHPTATKVSDNMLAIVYTDGTPNGQLVTIGIDNAGNITKPYQDKLNFSPVPTLGPMIAHMQGDIYLTAAEAIGIHGFTKSIDIETPLPAAPSQHLMMMGIG